MKKKFNQHQIQTKFGACLNIETPTDRIFDL